MQIFLKRVLYTYSATWKALRIPNTTVLRLFLTNRHCFFCKNVWKKWNILHYAKKGEAVPLFWCSEHVNLKHPLPEKTAYLHRHSVLFDHLGQPISYGLQQASLAVLQKFISMVMNHLWYQWNTFFSKHRQRILRPRGKRARQGPLRAKRPEDFQFLEINFGKVMRVYFMRSPRPRSIGCYEVPCSLWLWWNWPWPCSRRPRV